jgi:type I restriction enzyme S subunit
LTEVTAGVGENWRKYPLIGVTRTGLAPAKERIGKSPERYKLVTPGTIFYNPMRILLGSIAMVDDGEKAGITSPDYVVFKTVERCLHPVWFYFWLRSISGGAFIKTLARGAVRERMLFGRLAGAELEVPAWDVQVRVADQLRAVRRTRPLLETQFEAVNSLVAARLREIFDKKIQEWPVLRLGDVAEIVSGVTLGRKLPETGIRSVRYLRVANVKDGELSLDDVYETPATLDEITKLCLQYGDLLLTEGGDPDKLGRGTFWQEQIPECIHQNHIFRVRFDLERFSPVFVSAQIASAYGKQYFAMHAKQTTGIATINRTVLSGFPLLSPSLSVQVKVVEALNRFTEVAMQASRASREQLDAINAFPAALLRSAFNGEL